MTKGFNTPILHQAVFRKEQWSFLLLFRNAAGKE